MRDTCPGCATPIGIFLRGADFNDVKARMDAGEVFFIRGKA